MMYGTSFICKKETDLTFSFRRREEKPWRQRGVEDVVSVQTVLLIESSKTYMCSQNNVSFVTQDIPYPLQPEGFSQVPTEDPARLITR